jgi:hypothetical protein
VRSKLTYVSEENVAFIFRVKKITTKETSSAGYLLQAGFLLGIFFGPGNGYILLRKFC